MYKLCSKYLWVCLSILTYALFAQSGQTTPYSRYGIGQINEPFFVKGNSMGNVGSAIDNDTLAPYFINLQNPASHATIRMATFEAGAALQYSKLSTQNNKSTNNNISPKYLSLGFPITKWWGAAFSLMPYSSVGYEIFTDTVHLVNTDSVAYRYSGHGGTNRFTIGNGFKIGKSLKLGANATYFFGDITNQERIVFDPDPVANTRYYNIRNIQKVYIHKWYADYGLQYSHLIDSLGARDLKENVKITAGATFGLADKFNATSTTLSQTYLYTTSNLYESTRDTVYYAPDVKGTISIPMFWSAGLAIKKGERWFFAVDYRTQQWSNFEYLGAKQGFKNSSQIGIGAQYIPNRKAESSYLKRIQYRAGIRYNNSYLNIQNTQLTDKAISIGFGFPVAWSRIYQQYPVFNIAMEYGQMGTTDNNLIKQDYFRVTAGITICSRWFIKPKFD